MKHTLFPLILCLFLVSCANAGTATPTQPAPTSAPAYEPSVPALLTGLPSNKPADMPPEYIIESGGELKGISEADRKYLEAWEVYQKVYRDEVGPKTWPLDGSFEADMQTFLSGKADLKVVANQDADSQQVLVAVVKHVEGSDQWSVYWDFQNGVVANTDPMSVNPDWESGLVDLPKGTTPEFRYNPTDKHWYLFAVNANKEAVAWFATDGATIDNQANHWVEVAKPITEDIPAWLNERGTYWAEKLGYGSWAELVDKKVLGDPNYEGYEVFVEHKNLPYNAKILDGHVLEVVRVPLKSETLSKYGDYAWVAVTAFKGTEAPAMVLVGIEAPQGYQALIDRVYGGRPEFSTPELAKRGLEGKFWKINVVAQSGYASIGTERKSIIMDNKDDPKYIEAYKSGIADRSAPDVFWDLLAEEGTLSGAVTVYLNNGGWKTMPPELNVNSNGAQRMVWVGEQMGVKEPIIIADSIGEGATPSSDLWVDHFK